MFVGHTALALAAKRIAPETSLGTLVAATFALDLLWPLLLVAGIGRVRVDPGNTAFTPFAFDWYPWSHSLMMATVWGFVAILAYRVRGASTRSAATVGALVLSHWVLDLITHRPDLPLWPGASHLAGFGLWRSIVATILVESGMLVIGLLVYLRTTRATSAVGRWALAALIVLQLAIWLAGPWATPPPDPQAIAYAGFAMWLFVLWAAWFDRHRITEFHGKETA